VSTLDHLIAGARANDVSWTPDRASRVLAGALEKRDVRARRDRIVRRGLFVASVAVVGVLMFIRSASSSPSAALEAPAPAPQAEAIAAHAQGDGGYARD
jgi:hypothetical protein